MAPISKTLALAGALFAATSSAAPVKRDMEVVWETVTDVVWTTVDVTTTVMAGDTPVTTRITTPATEVPAQPTHSSEREPEPTEPVVTPTVASTPTTVPPPAEPTTPTTPPPAPTTTVAPPPPSPTVVTPPEEPSPTTPASTPTSTPGGDKPNPPSGGYSPTCSEDNPCTGQVTFYDTATSASAPGACGGTSNGHEENVIALPHSIMTEADCGKTVTIKYGGSTTTGKVVDKCMGCDSTSIDLSRHFFSSIAALAEGRLSGVTWWLS